MAGPFYFAWVDESETTFDAVAHKRNDEHVYDFVLSHAEGQFCSLDVTIENPRVGLITESRKIWAWLSYDHPSDGLTPLFFGRVLGVPRDLQEEFLTITLVARPQNFAEQKEAVAETLRTRPFWDPIWFHPDSVLDPDNVLEARPELWHTDRVSHEVTTSNIIVGEDGDLAFGPTDILADSLSMSYGEAPARAVRVVADISWQQEGEGTLDITQAVKDAFKLANSGNGHVIQSYTGAGLAASWPKPGTSLGGGWEFVSGSAFPLFYDIEQINFQLDATLLGGVVHEAIPYEHFIVHPQSSFLRGGLVFPRWNMDCNMELGWSASRKRSEFVTVLLEADVQPLLTEPSDQEVIEITLQTSEVSEPVDEYDELPIRDVRASSYVTTERGQQTIEYLIAVARARLLSRARCVTIEFEIPFDLGVSSSLSCRKNAVVFDPRLPGGVAAGKIVSYELSVIGDTGETRCLVAIGCTAGRGGSVSEIAGEPQYVEEDYVEDDYQVFDGQFVSAVEGEVVYAPLEGLPVSGDGFDLFHVNTADSVKSISVQNGAAAQQAEMPFHGPETTSHPHGVWHQFFIVPEFGLSPTYAPDRAINALNEIPTRVTIEMNSLENGPFETAFTVQTSQLKIPRLIDLEAEVVS